MENEEGGRGTIMTNNFVSKLRKQSRKLQTDIYTIIRSAKVYEGKTTKGIVPFLEEYGAITHITNKVMELRALCYLLIEENREGNNAKSK
jgi:hypothetical protein